MKNGLDARQESLQKGYNDPPLKYLWQHPLINRDPWSNKWELNWSKYDLGIGHNFRQGHVQPCNVEKLGDENIGHNL